MGPSTNIAISFPSWFYAVLTGGILAVAFLGGILYSQVRGVCKEFPKIQESLIRISEILLQKKIAKAHVYLVSASPIQLTDEGKKAIEESGFEKFYAANKSALIDRIKKKNPKTTADLEEACKEIMLSAENSLPSFDLLKQYSYGHGEPIAHILFASAIALRDILQKELNIKD